MKKILFLSLLCSCTHKYADYDLIRKVDFHKTTYERPVPVTQVLTQGHDEISQCFNQWLFFSNAEKEKLERTGEFVRALCPGKDYLVRANFSETWWTSIIFTQACISIKTMCGDIRVGK